MNRFRTALPNPARLRPANVALIDPCCILDLTAYLSTGDDRFNDVKLAAKCK